MKAPPGYARRVPIPAAPPEIAPQLITTNGRADRRLKIVNPTAHNQFFAASSRPHNQYRRIPPRQQPCSPIHRLHRPRTTNHPGNGLCTMAFTAAMRLGTCTGQEFWRPYRGFKEILVARSLFLAHCIQQHNLDAGESSRTVALSSSTFKSGNDQVPEKALATSHSPNDPVLRLRRWLVPPFVPVKRRLSSTR